MARLTLPIALLAALLLVAQASAFLYQKGGCQQQLQRVSMRHCEKHVMQKIQEEDEEEENVLSLRRNIFRKRSNNREEEEEEEEEELMKKCCNQLSELSERCMCPALQQVMEKQSEKLQRSEMQEMEKELKRLPKMCGFGPLRRCDLSPQEED